MKVLFATSAHGPERLICEAEIHFDEGPLAGTRLLGFCVWLTPDGGVEVTLPSRATGTNGDRRYFDYLRNAHRRGEAVRRVKAWILEEFRKQAGAATPERGRA